MPYILGALGVIVVLVVGAEVSHFYFDWPERSMICAIVGCK